MKTAFLVSTYNWPQALRMVLNSIAGQTRLPDEILIADDGSREETRILIDHFKEEIPVPVRHFWQEDKGFRKAMILNKAIAASECDYIIQTDGDCILHPDFIDDHIKQAEKGAYLYGSRVNILPDYVESILQKERVIFTPFSREIKNKTRTLHIPFLAGLYKPHTGISRKFRGCNVSYWRKDFLDVNGYNEDFEGWGREDSDLVIRMGNNGVLGKRLRYAGIVFHIYHKENSKHNLELNDSIQQKTLAEKVVRCKNGVEKYIEL